MMNSEYSCLTILTIGVGYVVSLSRNGNIPFRIFHFNWWQCCSVKVA